MQFKYIAALVVLTTMSIGLIFLFVTRSNLRFLGLSDSSGNEAAPAALTEKKRRHPEMEKFIPYRDAGKDAQSAQSEQQALKELEELLNAEHALAKEALLRFKSNDAFRSFLTTADAFGLDIVGSIPRLRALRVRYDDLKDLQQSLSGISEEDAQIAPNFAVIIPTIPAPNAQTSQQPLVPFRNGALEWLGLTMPNDSWGEGVLVAVLDTGVDPHATFRPGQVSTTDLNGQQSQGDIFGHGTAVASLIAGNDPATPGIAPAASILSYPVTNADGFSDSFTLASAIFDAIDAGAQIINISLASQGNSAIVHEAVTEALRNDVIVVAAAGNDGVQAVSYPASYPGVIGVGAVDATGQHVYFSNTGAGVSITAPGVGIPAAWQEGSTVQFSGTSASAPLVSGTLAAIYSQEPGISFGKTTDLLLNNTNEAGTPGVDNQHGHGNLSISRIMERNSPGIYDVAVASQTFGNPYIDASTSHRMLDIVVENRGTETLYNVELTVASSDSSREFEIPVLKAGETAVRQAPVDTARAHLDGSLQVTSSVTSNVKDRSPRDNRLTSTVIVNSGAK